MRRFSCYLKFALGLFAAGFPGLQAYAVGPAADALHVHVQLVAPTDLVAGQEAQAGLYIKLEPGWHVYWKNAGDAGEPPRIRWMLPEGVTAGEMQFPAPKRLPVGPLLDYGYEDEVLFPLALSADKGAMPGTAALRAKVDWIVCRESCIPGKAELEVDRRILAAGSGFNLVNPGDGALMERFAGSVPKPLPSGMKAIFTTTAAGFELAVLTGRSETKAQFFSDQPGILHYADTQKTIEVGSGANRGVGIDLLKEGTPDTPAKLTGVVELSGGRAYEIAAVPGAIPAAAAGVSGSAAGLFKAAGLAFLGGVILNLMPCVFPVLFIKGLSLVKASGEERHRVRGHGLVYTAGIVVSFWVVVGALLGLRAAGATLGWGFQFQSPIFVALMAGLLFFMGLSLAGQFEIGLTLTSAGGELAQKQGYAGSFFTGVLAVIVATPCTAPLMGAAIGYALAQSAVVTFAIFTALALGLAAPYLALTFEPAWTRLLPKPGVWMEVLKQATAVPIFATVIWLVWVLAQTRGATGVAAMLGTFLLLAIAGWILGRWPAQRIPSVAAGVVLVLAIGACVYGVQSLAAPVSVAAAGAGEAGANAWEPWSQAAVEKYRAAGRPVFVDFTASWCLSCQVNERVALRTSQVEAAFKKGNVALLKADWTSHDDAISQVLTSFGRSGVPAYALYGPGSGTPELLPEVLTPGIVVDALGKLK